MIGEIWYQELEATGRITSAAREQRVMGHGNQLHFPFLFSSGAQDRVLMPR